MTKVTRAVIVGGGIGGAATALSLARLGIKVVLLEKAHEIGEIGAGIQLGPNAFSALDSLGVGDIARQRAVFTDHITMMDAVNAEEVVRIETGQAFRDHFGGPYAVIHRVDIHASVWEAVLTHPDVEYHTSTNVVDIRETEDDVTVFDDRGNSWSGDILIGCDGVKSVVRQSLLGDAPRVTGHVVYRAVIDCADMPEDLRINAPVLWAGPHCHLVHYPLRGGKQYNLVVTFHSRQQEEWGVKDGSKEEVLSYFEGIHPRPRQMLDKPTSWRRWWRTAVARSPVRTSSIRCGPTTASVPTSARWTSTSAGSAVDWARTRRSCARSGVRATGSTTIRTSPSGRHAPAVEHLAGSTRTFPTASAVTPGAPFGSRAPFVQHRTRFAT